MIARIETVMQALLAQLTGAAVITFVAQGQPGNDTLLAPSTTTGLFPGLPVVGPGVASGTIVACVPEDGLSIVLSQPLTTDAVTGDATFTTGFQTTGRRAQHWTQVAAQPALFVRRVGVTYDAQEPYIVRTLHCEAWIYSNAGADADIAPDSILTGLEQMVMTAMNPDFYDDDGGRFTLSAALAALGQSPVYWCRPQGHSPVMPGDQGPQAVTHIPILITLP